MMENRRIVVTGMGIVSPLGCGVEVVWRRLLEGRSGISMSPPELVDGVSCKVGGRVPSIEEDPSAGFDPLQAAPLKDLKKMDRFIEFALMAAREALAQAGWTPQHTHEQERTATIIGTGVGGFGSLA